ncbi:MAG: hypothetical protein M3Y35_07650 [Actinomycetota bacterium]|nr:hypothetical protein [Actinomycetota bacterium]
MEHCQWPQCVGRPLITFFQPLGTYNFIYDVRAIYDTTNQRFVVTGGATDAANTPFILVAVSKDANPNDGWRFPAIPTGSGSDQPTVASDGTSLAIAASINNTQQAFIVDDGSKQAGTGLYYDGASTYQTLSPGTFAIYKPVAEPGEGDFFLAHDQNTLAVTHYTAATGDLGPSQTLSLGNVSSVGEQEFYLPTVGTNIPVDAEDQRVYGTAYAKGSVYATFEVLPPSGSDAGVPTAHWVELDVRDPATPRLVAQGDVSGSLIGPGVGTFDSSIAVNGDGDMIINFTASSASMAPTDYYVVHRASDPDGVFQAPVEYKTSVVPYVDPNAYMFGSQVVSRWGDYSSAEPDPNDPRGFWISSEYGTIAGAADWGTATARVLVNPAGSAAPLGVSAALASTLVGQSKVDSVLVADTAANVSGHLNALEKLAAAGELSSVALTDTGTPALRVTAAAVTADQGALDKIAGKYTLAVIGTSGGDTADLTNTSVPATVNLGGDYASASAGLSNPTLSFVGKPDQILLGEEPTTINYSLTASSGIEEIQGFSYGLDKLDINLAGAPSGSLRAYDTSLGGVPAISIVKAGDVTRGVVIVPASRDPATNYQDLLAHHLSYGNGQAIIT